MSADSEGGNGMGWDGMGEEGRERRRRNEVGKERNVDD